MAIAFDATGGGGFAGSTTPYTFSHTCTGSNRILFVAVLTNSVDNCSGVTYNGVAMTEIGRRSTISTFTTYLFYLVAPATGANNVVASKTASGNIFATSASYTGVRQSGHPDASNTNATASGTSLATSLTTITDNCWTIGAMSCDSTPTQLTAGASTTARNLGGATTYAGIVDSNAAKTPAGSVTLNLSSSGAQGLQSVIASFAPPTAYSVVLDEGLYTYTGNSAIVGRILTLLLSAGSYVLTGYQALLSFFGWVTINKSSTTFSNESKSSSSWSNQDKN